MSWVTPRRITALRPGLVVGRWTGWCCGGGRWVGSADGPPGVEGVGVADRPRWRGMWHDLFRAGGAVRAALAAAADGVDVAGFGPGPHPRLAAATAVYGRALGRFANLGVEA